MNTPNQSQNSRPRRSRNAASVQRVPPPQTYQESLTKIRRDLPGLQDQLATRMAARWASINTRDPRHQQAENAAFSRAYGMLKSSMQFFRTSEFQVLLSAGGFCVREALKRVGIIADHLPQVCTLADLEALSETLNHSITIITPVGSLVIPRLRPICHIDLLCECSEHAGIYIANHCHEAIITSMMVQEQHPPECEPLLGSLNPSSRSPSTVALPTCVGRSCMCVFLEPEEVMELPLEELLIKTPFPPTESCKSLKRTKSCYLHLGGDGYCVQQALEKEGITLSGFPSHFGASELTCLSSMLECPINCTHEEVVVHRADSRKTSRAPISLAVNKELSHCFSAKVPSCPVNMSDFRFIEITPNVVYVKTTTPEDCAIRLRSLGIRLHQLLNLNWTVHVDARPGAPLPMLSVSRSGLGCQHPRKLLEIILSILDFRTSKSSTKVDMHFDMRLGTCTYTIANPSGPFGFRLGADTEPRPKERRIRKPRSKADGSVTSGASSRASRRYRPAANQNFRPAKGKISDADNIGAINSLRSAIDSFSSSAKYTDEPEAQKKFGNQLAGLKTRLDALEKSKYLSANFGSKSFEAHDFSKVLNEGGLSVPCDTAESALATITDIVSGKAMHPKRFGTKDTSLVMKTVASKIMPLSSVTAGDTIYIAVPVTAAYKGAVVFRTTAAAPAAPIVVGYVAPDRDPENVGIMCAALFSKLSVSAPMVVGGTTTNLAQMMLELCHVDINPVALIAGKAAPLSRGRKCPIRVIGPETHDICCFTATEDEKLVKRFNTFDPQNQSLVKVPNGSYVPARSSARTLNSQNFALTLTGSNAADFAAAGFNADYSQNLTTVASATVVWDSNNCQDFLRHMLYGDFIFTVQGVVRNGAASNYCSLVLTTTYSDGSTVTNQTVMQLASNADVLLNSRFSSMGSTEFFAKAGLIITRMTVTINNNGSTMQMRGGDIDFRIDAEFQDVPVQQSYLCGVLSGATSASQLAVTLEVHTEVTIDPTCVSGTYLTPTVDLPYDPIYLPTILRLMPHLTATVPDAYSSAGFISGLKKFGRSVKKIAGGAARIATSGMPIIGDVVSELTSTSFGEGASGKRAHKALGICFPAVKRVADGVAYEIISFEDGYSPLTPAFASAAADESPFKPSVENYSGASCQLAFLLEALRRAHWPIRIGCYSGQIENVDNYGDEIIFEVYPVDCQEEKLDITSGDLTGLFSSGWYHHGSLATPRLSHLFGSRVDGSIEEIPLSDPYPRNGYRFHIKRNN